MQKQLQLYDLGVEEYLTNKYALWLDFRTIDENTLHGKGRRMENASERFTLQIEKSAESAGALNPIPPQPGQVTSSYLVTFPKI